MAQTTQDPLLPYINKIKSNVNDKDQILWKCTAATECYKAAATKFQEDNGRLRKEVLKIDGEINNLAPQVHILERTYKSQLETLKLGIESIIIHRLYKKCVMNNLNKQKEEWNQLTEKYMKNYQSTKEELEISNSVFQILQKQRRELRKSKVRCLMLRKKISGIKRIRQQKMQIKKQLFYRDIVNFAKIWLDKKKHFEAVSRARILKEKEIEWMKKLIDVTATLKAKQKMNYAKRDNFNKIFQIEFSKLTSDATLVEKAKPEVKIPPKADITFDELQLLIEKNAQSPPKSLEKIDYFPKTTYNSNYSKVRILDDKVINPCNTTNNTQTLTKEERSKALDAKLKKVVQNFNRKMSRKFSSRYTDGKKIDDFKKCSRNNSETHMEVDRKIETGTGATQDLEELNIISQDEADMKFVSQQSQGNSQPIAMPEESPIQTQIPVSKPDTFDAWRAYDKLSMSFMGQIQNKADGNQNSNDTFKKPETKHLVRNGQFSINFAGERQPNHAFKNPDSCRYSDSMNFNLVHKNDKEMASNAVKFQNAANENTGIGSFKALNTDNLFPTKSQNMLNMSANDSAIMSSYDPTSQTSNKEQMPMKFGEAQYDFGNITRFSQSDYCGNFSPNIMSPLSIPTDTEMPMNCVLPNTNNQPSFSFGIQF